MIRIAELKLPLSALPVTERLAADAPQPTREYVQHPDRAHPLDALRALAAQALGVSPDEVAELQRQFIQATQDMATMMERMQSLQAQMARPSLRAAA